MGKPLMLTKLVLNEVKVDGWLPTAVILSELQLEEDEVLERVSTSPFGGDCIGEGRAGGGAGTSAGGSSIVRLA